MPYAEPMDKYSGTPIETREAWQMFVDPLISAAIPTPEPPPVIWTVMSGFDFM